MALKKCPECGAEVSTSAKACPKCGHNLNAAMQAKGCLACVGIALVFVVIGWVNTTLFNGGDPTADDRQSAAVAACHEAVRMQLKAPDTASFSGERYFEREDVYTVSGAVDAENGFGATLRGSWTCTADPIGNGETYTATADLAEN